MIQLTQAERDRFATYLRQEAENDAGMAKQMQSLTGMEPMIKHLKQKAIAKILISKELESIEEMTL